MDTEMMTHSERELFLKMLIEQKEKEADHVKKMQAESEAKISSIRSKSNAKSARR